MDYERVKAHLNLYAVLQNLEELFAFDAEVAAAARDWDISLQFSIRGGPAAHLEFKNGVCQFGRGAHRRPTVKLFFLSPRHFNRMMDGKANPIPLKGFSHLGFLARSFAAATDKLAVYLKPTPERLADPDYLALNTRMTLNTAAHAVAELAILDPVGRLNAVHLAEGQILMKILPDGPAAHLIVAAGKIQARKGEADNPMAGLLMRDLAAANAFLTGKIDPFTAIVGGSVAIRGQIPMLDAVSNILDRIPVYLS